MGVNARKCAPGGALESSPAMIGAMSESLPTGSLAGADLAGRDLSGANLAGRDLSGANLAGADLSDAALTGATLVGADLSDARLDHADLTGATLDRSCLARAVLAGATFSEASLAGVDLTEADASHSEWRRAHAAGGDWRGVDLTGAVFERVKLQDVGLQDATLDGVHIADTDVERANLDGASAVGMQVLDTTFVDVSARGASLRDGSVRFADFKRVALEGADLDGARFEAVDLRGTRFDGVTAAGARFERCAGLDRAAKALLEDAGASLPVPLLGRIAGAVAGSSAATRLTFLLLIGLSVGGYVWYSMSTTNPGNEEIGPQELVGEQRAAFARLEERFDTEPDARIEILREMAAYLDELGASAAAESKLREAMDQADRDGDDEPPLGPMLDLGDFFLRHERFDDALAFARELDQAGAGRRERAVSQLVLVRTLIARGNAERADAALDELVERIDKVPADLSLRVLTAGVIESVRGASAALPLLDDVPASLDLQGQGEVALERAALLARMGYIGEAVKGYDAATASFADLPLIRERAREERAHLLKMGTDPEAEEVRLRELAAGEGLLAAQSALGLARLAVRRGAVDEARSAYIAVRMAHSDQEETRVTATVELAELLSTTGAVEEAEQLLREELEGVTGKEPSLHLRQAIVDTRYRSGDLPGAVEEARATVRWAGADLTLSLRARLQLAGMADEAGAYDEAIDLYRAVALEAEDPALIAAAWFGQATLMRRRGSPESALPLMDSALQHLPAQHEFRGAIIAERAEVLAELGQSSPAAVEAMLVDARAAGLPTSQPVAYGALLLMLGRELATVERHEDALTVFEQVAASPAAGEDPRLGQDAVQGQVAALVALGRKDQATALLDSTSVDGLTNGGAEERCEAMHGLAVGRVGAGEVDAAIEDVRAMLASCRSPRFLVARLPELSDLFVDVERVDVSEQLIAEVFSADGVPEVGRQAAALELGRLGSVEHLDHAAAGPDESLAALAKIETATRLEGAGELEQARSLLESIAEDESAETFPRGLAQLGLGRMAAAGDDKGAARVWLVQARDAGDPWLRERATEILDGLDGSDGS